MTVCPYCGRHDARVRDRYVVESTGGPVEMVRITCPAGHCYNGPAAMLARCRRMYGPRL